MREYNVGWVVIVRMCRVRTIIGLRVDGLYNSEDTVY